MAVVGQKVLRCLSVGPPVGADIAERYLTGGMRAAVLDRLTAEARERERAMNDAAREQAASLVAATETQAGAIRAAAWAEGFIAGRAEGRAAGLADLEPGARLLRRAVEDGMGIRDELIRGAETDAVQLALAVAARVVGAVAQDHAQLAAALVVTAIRENQAPLVQIRVHGDDAHLVSLRLADEGSAPRLLTDAAVEVGGCILDLESGTIDLQPSAQLATIRSALAPDSADWDGWRPVRPATTAAPAEPQGDDVAAVATRL